LNEHATTVIVIFLIILALIDLKSIYFFLSLKKVRIWLESKTPTDLKANIRKFKTQIIIFFSFTVVSIAGVIVALAIEYYNN
jgi:hypothetical protein